MPSRRIGALWLKEKKNDDGTTMKYMSGVLNDLSGDINIAVFKNTKKEKDNHPDYNIVVSERQEKKPAAQAEGDDVDTSDIPF